MRNSEDGGHMEEEEERQRKREGLHEEETRERERLDNKPARRCRKTWCTGELLGKQERELGKYEGLA